MKISVVIPVYNGEKFIADAISSVLSQTFSASEIIVINDCSTDNTLDVLATFNNKIKIITNKKNSGASFSRNQGIRAASYDFIAFLDADDIWYPNKISRQVSLMEEHIDCRFSYGQATLVSFESYNPSLLNEVDNTISLARIKPFIEIFESPYFSTSTIITSKQLCIDCGLFREDLKTAEDIDLCYKIAYKTKPLEILAPLSVTRRVKNSLGSSETSYQDNLLVIDEFIEKNKDFRLLHKRSINRLQRKIYDDWVSELLFNRKVSSALRVIRNSLRVKPSKLTYTLIIKAFILKFKYR